MSFDLKKIKVKENKNKTKNSPDYLISYDCTGSDEKVKQESYKIISALIKNKDIILEIKTELLSLTRQNREDYVLNFLNDIKTLGLNYRYKKLPPSASKGIFSFDFLIKPIDNHEIITYVPNEIWNNPQFAEKLPIFSIKYNILKEKLDINIVLDQINNGHITGDELFTIFDLAVFDCSRLGQMGIFTKSKKLEDIKTMLSN